MADRNENDPPVVDYAVSYPDDLSRKFNRTYRKTLNRARLFSILAAASAGVYEFFLLGYVDGFFSLIMTISGWIGTIAVVIACASDHDFNRWRLKLLNAGIILMWGRFWMELFYGVADLARHPNWAGLRFLVRTFDWISDLPIPVLLIATFLVLCFDIAVMRNLKRRALGSQATG